MSGRRLVIVGCARDCATALPESLMAIDRLCVAGARAVIAENDSVDATPAILAAWVTPDKEVLTLTGRISRNVQRTMRIAEVRNILRDYVMNNYGDYEYMLVVDMDGPIGPGFDLTPAIELLDRDTTIGAVFPNCAGRYYDIWALRGRGMAVDCWDYFNHMVRRGVDRERARWECIGKFQTVIPVTNAPIDVMSAFGGAGLYRLAATCDAPRYDGVTRACTLHSSNTGTCHQSCCEHVSFNQGVKGRRVILPGFLVRAQDEHCVPKPGASV